MNIGIVVLWDGEQRVGLITSNGETYRFAYAGGRTIIVEGDRTEPEFGTHDQPAGFALKVPRVGDIVVFIAVDSDLTWGYAEHYLSAATRKTSSAFIFA